MEPKEIPSVTTIQDDIDEIPIIKDMYIFFSPRSKSITALSYGFGSMGIETFLTGATGCEVKIFDSRPGSAERFEKYRTILQTHSAGENPTKWETFMANQYILPKKITFNNSLPFSYSGSLDISGVHTSLTKFTEKQIDFLKVDYDIFNTQIIYTVINSGYRPGIILMNWSNHPDNYTDSMLCAGHLQNTGYRLIGQKGSWFLYLFMDDCIYEMCSWARIDVSNPFLEDYKSFIISNFLNSTSNSVEKSSE
jgi:hypothetical protein